MTQSSNREGYSADSFYYDLRPQAIRLGKRILPNEQYYHSSFITIYGTDKSGAAARYINITLIFRSKNKETNYSGVIEISYGLKSKSAKRMKGSTEFVVWLQEINITKNSRLFDPPSMHDVKKLKKVSTGRWINL